MFEALRFRFKKVPQVEFGVVQTVPFLQLLELQVPGERGHGGTGEVHGAGRARKRKEEAAAARSKPGVCARSGLYGAGVWPRPSRSRLWSPRPRPARVLRARYTTLPAAADLGASAGHSVKQVWPFAISLG